MMQSRHLDMLWRQRGKCISRGTLPPWLRVGSNHPQETLLLSRETSVEAFSLCCVSLPHTSLFHTLFLRGRRSQRAKGAVSLCHIMAQLHIFVPCLLWVRAPLSFFAAAARKPQSRWGQNHVSMLAFADWYSSEWRCAKQHLKLGVLNQSKSKVPFALPKQRLFSLHADLKWKLPRVWERMECLSASFQKFTHSSSNSLLPIFSIAFLIQVLYLSKTQNQEFMTTRAYWLQGCRSKNNELSPLLWAFAGLESLMTVCTIMFI